jgi:iron complex outermembrane receptor protein
LHPQLRPWRIGHCGTLTGQLRSADTDTTQGSRTIRTMYRPLLATVLHSAVSPTCPPSIHLVARSASGVVAAPAAALSLLAMCCSLALAQTPAGGDSPAGAAVAPAAPASAPAAAAAPAAAPAPAAVPAPASAPVPAGPTLERVEITGAGPSDSETRRQSTASKIVIGRDELDRMGDTSVADVLKRLPGVTIGGRPGRGGEIRMRGLGSGYTQIMVNGERIPPGFSIDTLTPEQIERIEVSRAPTAETGARAIAGTINIVLREDVKRRLNNVNISLGHEAGQNQPSVSWTRGDQLGDLSYNLSASAYRQHRVDRSEIDTSDLDAAGTPTLAQHEQRASLERREGIHLGGRVAWRLGAGESLSFMPFLLTAHSTSDANGVLNQDSGTPNWLISRSGNDLSFSVGRATLLWQGRTGVNRYELRGGLNRAISDSHGQRQEFGGQAPQSQTNSGLSNEGGWSSAGKFSRSIGADHSVALGWEGEGQRRSESKISTINGLPQVSDFGDNLGARTLRNAAWAQDEWNLGNTWSAYAGLRWEAITTSSDGGASGAPASANGEADRLRNRSRIWTPLLHSVWKLDEASKDQVRFALTRSYRSPTLANLVNRPSLSLHNSATQPDRVGNPALLPELATGIDLAFEHYFSAGGLASVSVFQRRINKLIRTLTTFEPSTLNGVNQPRWLAQPQNVGDASSSGVELEAKFRLAEVWQAAWGGVPNVDLRSNLSVFRSRVSGVQGPDNRLDQQPRASANLGADWKFDHSPLSLGTNFNWTPSGQITLSSDAANGGTSQSAYSSAKRVIDAYALWTFSPAVQLRMSGANLLAEDALGTSRVVDPTRTETAVTLAQTWRVWSLKLELKL